MLIISLLAAAVAAAGPPAYLRCSFPPNAMQILVTADEANSAVTVSIPDTGYAAKLPAAFTATEVLWQNPTLTYVVNRVDLTVRRTDRVDNSTDAGTCKVEDAAKRAF